MTERGDWCNRAEARVVTGAGHDTGINRYDHPGPLKLVCHYEVRTKDARLPCGPEVNRVFCEWLQEAEEKAAQQAKSRGLPLFEIGPTMDALQVIRGAPDAVFLCHVVLEEFGDPIRDASRIGRLYPSARLEEIEKNAPPNVRAE